jgi:hypothetical protein
MKITLQSVYIVLVLLIVAACSSDDGEGSKPDNPVSVDDPKAATLIFPKDGEQCNEGTILSDTESSVTFRWNPSDNTDSYTLTLKNLKNGSRINTNVTDSEATITIARGTPYDWYVTSKANGTSAVSISETWQFFNEGPGIESFAPFPAEATFPSTGAVLWNGTDEVLLRWTAIDVDDDISNYEVFFGLEIDTLISIGIVTDKKLSTPVSSGNIYNWKVIVNDSRGNSSTSDVFQFKVDP